MSDARRFPGWLVVLLCVAAALTLAPFVPWMALAIWFGLYARRFHGPLTRRLGGRERLAAALTVSSVLLVALPIAAVVTSIVLDAVTLIRQLLETGQGHAVLERLASGDVSTGGAAQDATGVLDVLFAQGDRALAIARNVAGVAATFGIGMLILVTGMYGVLVEGRGWYAWIEEHAPLSPAHLDRLAAAFIETGRGLWWGIVGAGFLQALAATITYLALGVPSALALGLLTLVFSVIPAVGTAIVWVPVTAGLAVTGRPGAAIVLGVVGVAVIGSIDNLARPWLARRGELQLPSWVVLVAMFGGIEVAGAWGLVLGPLVVRLAKEAIVIARSRLVTES